MRVLVEGQRRAKLATLEGGNAHLSATIDAVAEVEVEDGRSVTGAATGSAMRFSAATDSARIAEHMDVIASDGAKIGVVDHLDGPDRIKLAKNASPDGQHHYVPLTWVDHVDTHVHLNKTAMDAKAGW